MPFLEEDDDEAMHEELKEAFRLYDKEGRGYAQFKKWYIFSKFSKKITALKRHKRGRIDLIDQPTKFFSAVSQPFKVRRNNY